MDTFLFWSPRRHNLSVVSNVICTFGKPLENLWKTLGKPLENLLKTLGKPLENLGETFGKGGSRGGSVGSAFDCEPMCCRGPSPRRAEHFGFPPGAPRLGNQRPWYVYSRVYATGHIKDPVPLIAKRRELSPGGRFPPSFIHQVIIITGLNKLYNRNGVGT